MLTDFIESLKAERSRRQLSLKALSEMTGISVRMLRAFEAAQFDRFGAPVILRNVIRAYCAAFQVDPEPYLEKYSAEIAVYDKQQERIVEHGKRTRKLYRKRRVGTHSLLLLAIAAVGIISGGIWVSERRARLALNEPLADRVFSQQDLPSDLQSSLPPLAAEQPVKKPAQEPGQPPLPVDADRAAPLHESSEPSMVPAEPTVVAERGPDLPEVGTKPPALTNATEVQAEERAALPDEGRRVYRFVVEADQKTWVQVRIDDKYTRNVMLHAGERREWHAERGMQIVIGNAGGVRMRWDDHAVKSPGGSGRVFRFRLPDQQYMEDQG